MLRDTVRRLLITHAMDGAACNVQAALQQPHGLFGISQMLLEHFIDGEDLPEIGVIAGTAELVSGFALAAFQLEPLTAPPTIILDRDPIDPQIVSRVPVPPGTGVLILMEVHEDGLPDRLHNIIWLLKWAGLEPRAALAVVARDGATGAQEGVPFSALFRLDELQQLRVDDYTHFRPDPAGGEGYYFLPGPQGWQACSESQNRYLGEVPEENKVPVEGDIFYVKGVLRA